MNSYSNTLLIISIFLAVSFVGCQTYENKEASEHSSLSLKNIGKDSSKFSLISGYDENNYQQKRQSSINISRVGSEKPPTAPPTTTVKVTSRRLRVQADKYIKMKYKLYRDINNLRIKYHVKPLIVNMTLSIELQKFALRYAKNDKDLEPRLPAPDEIYYFCPSNEEYDPIGYWSTDKDLLTKEYIEMGILDLFFSKLIWKSSTHIGCGVYGSKFGIVTLCKITPRGNIKGQYDENVFYRAD
uniref:SCP domain-containing protein n=1 Tax=Strongyloides papillosus TaxID=174720 RepID=A0A0N5CAZ4_STREA